MKTKVLAILLCSALSVCGLAGCSNEAKDTDASLNEQVIVSEQDNNTNYKTIKPPADGWTIEELLSVTYVCGKQLSYPLTVDSFGDELHIDEESKRVSGSDGEHIVDADLMYGSKYVGVVFWAADTIEDVTDSTPIKTLTLYVNDDDENDVSFSINGASYGDSKDEVLKALGSSAVDSSEHHCINCVIQEDINQKIVAGYNDDIFRSLTIKNISLNESQEQTESEATEENTSSFNMDETLENTLLCGVKLSPDMTLGMLGEDFTIEYTETSYSEKRNALT